MFPDLTPKSFELDNKKTPISFSVYQPEEYWEYRLIWTKTH